MINIDRTRLYRTFGLSEDRWERLPCGSGVQTIDSGDFPIIPAEKPMTEAVNRAFPADCESFRRPIKRLRRAANHSGGFINDSGTAPMIWQWYLDVNRAQCPDRITK